MQNFKTASNLNRVVVTGIGMMTPLGVTPQENWQALQANKVAIRDLKDDRYNYKIAARYGGALPSSLYSQEFQDEYRLRMFSFHQTVAHGLLRQTLLESKLFDMETKKLAIENDQVGMQFSQIIGPTEQRKYMETMQVVQYLSVQGFLVSVSSAIDYGLKGNFGAIDYVSGGSQMLVLEAHRQIAYGKQKAIVVGGIDVNLGTTFHKHMSEAGLLHLNKKVKPQQAIKPYDEEMSGTLLSDGGAMLVLESLESAQARNARIFCEVISCSSCTGASSSLLPSQRAVDKCLIDVLHSAGWVPGDVQLLSGNGSGVRAEDELEARALKRVWGSKREDFEQRRVTEAGPGEQEQAKRLMVNSHKGNLGHLAVNSGIAESALLAMQIAEGKIIGTANLKKPIDDGLHFLKDGETLNKQVDKAVKLSFGPGITVAATAFQKFEP